MEKLRIISGKYKGRTLKVPDTKGVHPMGSREKIALFNMINDAVPGNFVLDAFSGSGALGIEAISRGAGLVVFLEKSHVAYRTIIENLESIGEYGRHGIPGCGDAYKILATATDRFGIVIADPPYDKYDPEKIKVVAKVVADPIGILVLSHPGEAPEMPGLKLEKTRSYAGANISVYHHI